MRQRPLALLALLALCAWSCDDGTPGQTKPSAADSQVAERIPDTGSPDGATLDTGTPEATDSSAPGTPDAGPSDMGGQPQPGPNPTVVENRRIGAPDFYLGGEGVGCHVRSGAENTCVLEAYANRTSVGIGETIAFHVSGQDGAGAAVPYGVQIFRLGFYDGDGAALLATLDVNSPATKRSMPHPSADTGIVRAGWPVSFQSTVGGEGWLDPQPHSGQYVAKLTASAGPEAGYATFVPFVVRPQPNAHAEVLVVVPDLTWQAYNKWGGANFYGTARCPGTVSGESTPDDPSDDCPECCERIGNLMHPAVAVSFDRPYGSTTRSRGMPGTAHLSYWEYWTILWLEREGYNVAYASGLDVHDPVLGDPAGLAERFKILASIGHDEYWTRGLRDHFEQARAEGAHLMFLSANTSAWQIRLEDNGRTLVGYKYVYFRDPLFSTDDPDTTGPYRAFNPADVCALDPTLFPPCDAPAARLNRPEATLTGLLASDLTWPWGTAHVPPNLWDHWSMEGLGLSDGDDAIAAQVLGHEGMTDDPDTRPRDGTLTILAEDRNLCHVNALAGEGALSMSLWAPSVGGLVFNSGSIHWGWFLQSPIGLNPRHACSSLKFNACSGEYGCDTQGSRDEPLDLPSERVRQLTRNILDCFSGRRALDPSCAP